VVLILRTGIILSCLTFICLVFVKVNVNAVSTGATPSWYSKLCPQGNSV